MNVQETNQNAETSQYCNIGINDTLKKEVAAKEKAALEVGSALRTSQLPKASVSRNVHLFCLDNLICSPSLSHKHTGLVCKNCLFSCYPRPGVGGFTNGNIGGGGGGADIIPSICSIYYEVLGYIQRISKDSSCIGVLVNGEGPGEAVDSVGEGFGGGGYCVLANSRYFGTG